MNSRSCSPSGRGAVALAQVMALGPLPLLLAIAQDWYVDVNAPGCPLGTGTYADPFCDIMDAVAAASNGDTIHIAPGTYFENLVIDEDLQLIGTGGQVVTILDGGASGSVVHVLDAAVTLTGLTLTNGTGTPVGFYGSSGGGLLAESTVGGDMLPRVTLTGCTVSGNSARYGGGLCSLSDGSLELVDSSVSGNSASSDGGGINGAVTMSNSTVGGNTAGYAGGGILGHSHLTNSTVSYNTVVGPSGQGGGIFGNAVLVSSSVIGNTVLGSYGTGGGIFSGSGLELSNSIVALNNAEGYGGIESTGSGLTITNSTITGNTSTGVGICCGAYATITNSVLSANGAYGSLQIVGAYTYASVQYSLLEGVWPGAGNIDADPLFRDPASGDFRLASGSPCIDAGNDLAVPPGITTDLEGKPRFIDDLLTPDTGVGLAPVVDMGAYEYGVAHAKRVRRR